MVTRGHANTYCSARSSGCVDVRTLVHHVHIGYTVELVSTQSILHILASVKNHVMNVFFIPRLDNCVKLK